MTLKPETRKKLKDLFRKHGQGSEPETILDGIIAEISALEELVREEEFSGWQSEVEEAVNGVSSFIDYLTEGEKDTL